MFLGRQHELSELNRLHQSFRFEFVVMYGRRRIGKTALINEFLKGKKGMYYVGIESNAKQNLENFSQCVLADDQFLEDSPSFNSFQTALEYVFKKSEKVRLILAIDEYPYLAKSDKSFASTLQALIDKYKSHSKLMLILCGSSMSYMQDEVLAYKAPLYGRRTAQMKIEPFSFEESCLFLDGFNSEDKALLYGMVGGTPQYLQQIDKTLSVEENLKCTFLNPSSAFFFYLDNLLKQEIREASTYNAILFAIAAGASKLSEIANKVGEPNSTCSNYLINLIRLGLVKKEIPYGQKESGKKSLYSIQDPLFRFWFRFVAPNRSLIEKGAKEIVFKRIKPHLSEFMGAVFEEICKQYLWNQMLKGKSAVEFNELGRWWGTDNNRKIQTEVDIVGSQNRDKGLLAECKWRNDPVDVTTLKELLEKSRLFDFTEVYFYLFSKNGFTKACLEEAKKIKNIRLISFGDMRH